MQLSIPHLSLKNDRLSSTLTCVLASGIFLGWWNETFVQKRKERAFHIRFSWMQNSFAFLTLTSLSYAPMVHFQFSIMFDCFHCCLNFDRARMAQ